MPLEVPADGIVYDDPESGAAIRAYHSPSDEFITMLSGLRFGGDGLKYRRLNVAEQLARLPSPSYVELELNGHLVGSYMLANTSLESGKGPIDGVYRGLLGLEPDARDRGLGRTLVAETLRWIERCAIQAERPLLSWGCIEASNVRSMELLGSLGAERLGELESLTVFRQWPKRSIDAQRLEADALGDIEQGLATSYADCALRSVAGDTNGYWAVTDDTGIVAGARALLTRVDMTRTGSAWDAAWQRLLRFIPPAKRRFDPRNFTYLRLSDVVVRAGHEDVWRELLPTLLAEHDAYLGMFVLDTDSEARRRLGRAGLFGRLTASTRQRIAILAHSWNVSSSQVDEFRRLPLAIAPLDL